MVDVFNLRRVRKHKQRAAAAAAAQDNRLKFGQSKAARTLVKLSEAQAEKSHAAHLRVPRAKAPDHDNGR